MRYHLKYKNIHATVRRATDELFAAGPWSEDEGHVYSLFTRWLQRASDAYGVPTPSLEIRSYDRALARRGVDVETGQITMAKYSVINLFHGFRHHLQQMGTIVTTSPDAAEVDAIGWACSLFYIVRPHAFRKAVRAGRIQYVAPHELLTSATLEAQLAERQQADTVQRVGVSALDGDNPDVIAFREGSNDPLDGHAAAEILGISPSRVRQLTDDLEGFQEGRFWRYSAAAVRREAARRGIVIPVTNVAPVVEDVATDDTVVAVESSEYVDEETRDHQLDDASGDITFTDEAQADADQELIDSGELEVQHGPTDEDEPVELVPTPDEYSNEGDETLPVAREGWDQ